MALGALITLCFAVQELQGFFDLKLFFKVTSRAKCWRHICNQHLEMDLNKTSDLCLPFCAAICCVL